MFEQKHPGPKILSYPKSAICITPKGATPLWSPNITIKGKNAPIINAGAQLAFTLKKLKNVAKYPPKIVPIGPNTDNASVPIIINVSIGINTNLTDCGIHFSNFLST